MLELGTLELGRVPRVAVSFTDRSSLEDVERARAAGVDIAEVRIDRFSSFDPEHVRDVLGRFSGIPTIGTIRTEAEGGRWVGADEDRERLFLEALPWVDAIDVELRSESILSALRARASEANKLLIVSYHDHRLTPDPHTLERIADDAEKAGADIVKIATNAGGRDDIRSLATFSLRNRDKNLIVIGMSDYGLLTRLLFPALGSLITYSFIDQPTAPGQLRFVELFDWMRRLYPDFDAEKTAELRRAESP